MCPRVARPRNSLQAGDGSSYDTAPFRQRIQGERGRGGTPVMPVKKVSETQKRHRSGALPLLCARDQHDGYTAEALKQLAASTE